MPLINCPDCQLQVSDSAPNCPRCGRPIAQHFAPPAPKGHVVTKTVHAGMGVVLQLFGALFFLPSVVGAAWVLLAGASAAALVIELPGLLFGGLLLAWGGRLARRHLCSVCELQLTGTEVRQCPACKADLSWHNAPTRR